MIPKNEDIMSEITNLSMNNKNTLHSKQVFTTDNNNSLNGRLVVEERNDEVITERRYGCYRLGLLIASVIIFILVIGCVPVFVTTDNSKLILIVLIITLIIVGLLTFAYFEYQRRHAIHMRQNSIRGAYTTLERRTKEEQRYANLKKKHEDRKRGTSPNTKYSPV